MGDHMTHRVLFRVHEVPWSQWFGPFQMPAPMNAWGVRPFSVLLLKTYAEIFGPAHIPPSWLLFSKSAASMCLFGLAAAHWLRVHGLGRWALPVMFSTLLLAPNLFTSWYLPELDNLGAAALLWGCAGLSRPGPLSHRGIPVIAALLFGGFLKESSGLLAIGLFSAGGIMHWAANEGQRMRRHLVGLGLTLGGWVLLTLPMMIAQESLAAQESLWGKVQVIEHNSAQLVYLLGSAGVVLLALGAWLPRLPDASRLAVCLSAIGLLLASPLMVFYSHYEAIYYGPRLVALALSIALWLGLLWGCTATLRRLRAGKRDNPTEEGLCWCALSVLGASGAITLAVLISPTAREDLASRIFIPMAPMLHAAAFEGAARIWRALQPRYGRTGTLASGLLVGAMAWYPIASAVNFSADWRAMQPVDMEGRSQLVSQGIDNRVVMFNHYVQWMGHYEMQALGAPSSVETDTHFAQVYAWLGDESFPDSDWGAGLLELEEGYELNVPMDLYWLTRRSQMSEEANEQLQGDLSWTRRPVGLFTPINWNPDDAPDAAERTARLPEHNRPEDLRMTRYGPSPTPLEALAEERGEVLWTTRKDYIQVPPNLLEIPRRLLSLVPLIESHVYEARHYRLGPREGEAVGEISEILTETEKLPPPGPPSGGGPPPGGGDHGGGPPPGPPQNRGQP
jgi:hypothetical protein